MKMIVTLGRKRGRKLKYVGDDEPEMSASIFQTDFPDAE